ncbi:hypothetical protein RHGRI_035963 [Rhododendron griersonianum]|uniref:Uncharacterized protein n=1 Tax=Rhododendron griersonianum TaxID=479676 RepID=A0AAV6HRW5_9ERIC|nr:hypothetical protein RHGRI_035963 [Rhododendron griersonianum]
MAGYSRLQFVFFLFLLASMCAIQVSMIAFRHVTFGVPRPTDPMIVSSYAKYVVLGVFVFHQAPLVLTRRSALATTTYNSNSQTVKLHVLRKKI